MCHWAAWRSVPGPSPGRRLAPRRACWRVLTWVLRVEHQRRESSRRSCSSAKMSRCGPGGDLLKHVLASWQASSVRLAGVVRVEKVSPYVRFSASSIHHDIERDNGAVGRAREEERQEGSIPGWGAGPALARGAAEEGRSIFVPPSRRSTRRVAGCWSGGNSHEWRLAASRPRFTGAGRPRRGRRKRRASGGRMPPAASPRSGWGPAQARAATPV